jgi:hypothetical protein
LKNIIGDGTRKGTAFSRANSALQVAEKIKTDVIPKRSEEPAFICVLKTKRVPPPGEDAGRRNDISCDFWGIFQQPL